MSGWTIHEGTAVAMPLENVDTDQLIPARFMSTPREAGYGSYLLHDIRDAPEVPLARHPQASVLVAGRNFGSGSSREAAVYALVDHGFRAVIAPSFGDIFSANAVNNGLLPAVLPEAEVAALMQALGPDAAPCRIDLAAGRIALAGHDLGFDLRSEWREKLCNGWDDIDLTNQHAEAIATFRRDMERRQPYAVPKQNLHN